MNIDGIILEKYAAGWVLKTPVESKDKNGDPKMGHKNSYHSNLGQSLDYIRDNLAKDCDTALDLIALLESARWIDAEVLTQNGLIETPKRIAA